MQNQRFVDRRSHKRFKAEDGAFAVLRNHRHKLGPILDISKRGLSLKYISDRDRQNEETALDIFVIGQDVLIQKIPFKTVSDFEIEQDIPFSHIRMKRRGVQFGQLQHFQEVGLENFLRYHTLNFI